MLRGTWRKSSKCASGTCVEVRQTAGAVQVRDSKDIATPPLTFTAAAWSDFILSTKNGQFDH